MNCPAVIAAGIVAVSLFAGTAAETRVEEGGPAHAAGFRPGDVIIAVNGWAVKDLHHFHERLGRQPIGQPVDVMVWRQGETLALRPVTEVYR